MGDRGSTKWSECKRVLPNLRVGASELINLCSCHWVLSMLVNSACGENLLAEVTHDLALTLTVILIRYVETATKPHTSQWRIPQGKRAATRHIYSREHRPSAGTHIVYALFSSSSFRTRIATSDLTPSTKSLAGCFGVQASSLRARSDLHHEFAYITRAINYENQPSSVECAHGRTGALTSLP